MTLSAGLIVIFVFGFLVCSVNLQQQLAIGGYPVLSLVRARLRVPGHPQKGAADRVLVRVYTCLSVAYGGVRERAHNLSMRARSCKNLQKKN